ncbi:MAG: GyrI-like domain-containing protein [Planctomycetota bacterium]
MTKTPAPLRSRSALLLAALAATALTAACAFRDTSAQAYVEPVATQRTFVPSLRVSDPPFDEFHPSWMQRLDQPYVYMEHYGSYTETGAHLPSLLREMKVQGLEPDGPPFCLFYDDPAFVPTAELRSRACVPIRSARSPRTPLSYDVLPSTTVAYAFVSGPYPDVPKAYPHIFEFMAGFDWVAAGPIREIYYVPPSSADHPSEALCEIQVPVGRAE